MIDYTEECLSSLQFANRCRNVQNQPRINYIGEREYYQQVVVAVVVVIVVLVLPLENVVVVSAEVIIFC